MFDCFCSSSDPDKCSWSAAKKIKEMKCQPALCPDLQTDETKGWSCSGRAKYDLCWAPCHVGLMVKGQGVKLSSFGSLWKAYSRKDQEARACKLLVNITNMNVLTLCGLADSRFCIEPVFHPNITPLLIVHRSKV